MRSLRWIVLHMHRPWSQRVHLLHRQSFPQQQQPVCIGFAVRDFAVWRYHNEPMQKYVHCFVCVLSLSAVCCPLSFVCCLLSFVCCRLCVVCCRLSAVVCPLSFVCCCLSGRMSFVCCRLSLSVLCVLFFFTLTLTHSTFSFLFVCFFDSSRTRFAHRTSQPARLTAPATKRTSACCSSPSVHRTWGRSLHRSIQLR